MSEVLLDERPSLVRRALNMFIRPYDEWGVIQSEHATVRGLLFPYAVVLAGIGPLVSAAISLAGFKPTDDIGWLQSILATVIGVGLGWGLNLITAIVLAYVISEASNRFGGKGSNIQAYKVAIYSTTIPWLSDFAAFIPYVGVIIGLLLMIYGLYVLYIGLHRLMKIPGPQRVISTVCVLLGQFFLMSVVSVVTFIAIGTISKLFGLV